MEILRLSGYSEEEKMQIARRYLIPRQLKEAGLNDEQCAFTDEALQKLISGYTREAGLRRLERAIGRVTRKVALRFAEGNTEPVNITPEDITEMLGPEPFNQEADAARYCLPEWRRAWPGPKPAAMSSTSKPRCCPTARV